MSQSQKETLDRENHSDKNMPDAAQNTDTTPEYDFYSIVPWTSSTSVDMVGHMERDFPISFNEVQNHHIKSVSPSGSATCTDGPKMDITSTFVNKDQNVCAICEDKASGIHYGITSCEGCKGFFRRTVLSRAVYTCARNGHCNILRRNRNKCKFCRLKKCLEAGMNRKAVREDKRPGGRHGICRGVKYSSWDVKQMLSRPLDSISPKDEGSPAFSVPSNSSDSYPASNNSPCRCHHSGVSSSELDNESISSNYVNPAQNYHKGLQQLTQFLGNDHHDNASGHNSNASLSVSNNSYFQTNLLTNVTVTEAVEEITNRVSRDHVQWIKQLPFFQYLTDDLTVAMTSSSFIECTTLEGMTTKNEQYSNLVTKGLESVSDSLLRVSSKEDDIAHSLVDIYFSLKQLVPSAREVYCIKTLAVLTQDCIQSSNNSPALRQFLRECQTMVEEQLASITGFRRVQLRQCILSMRQVAKCINESCMERLPAVLKRCLELTAEYQNANDHTKPTSE